MVVKWSVVAAAAVTERAPQAAQAAPRAGRRQRADLRPALFESAKKGDRNLPESGCDGDCPGNLGERFPGGTSPWGTSSGKTKLVPRGNVPLGDVPPGNDE